MTFQLLTNNTKFDATNSGAGDFLVLSAFPGYLAPEQSNVINGRSYNYYAQSLDGKQWESGSGTYNTTTHTLSRTSVVASSNPDLSKVSFILPPIVDVFPAPQANLQAITRGYLSGLGLSVGSSLSNIFGIAAGQAMDSTNVQALVLFSAYTKTTSAWAVGSGNGALDVGSVVASNTVHYPYLIMRVDTGVIDICLSASPTAPTFGANIPAAYTLFRRIGALMTNTGVGFWKIWQFGDQFWWDIPKNDVTAFTGFSGASPANFNLSVPPGIPVIGQIQFYANNSAGSPSFFVVYPQFASQPPLTANWAIISLAAGLYDMKPLSLPITNGQVSAYVNNGGSGTDTIYITTMGWIDRRGRDS